MEKKETLSEFTTTSTTGNLGHLLTNQKKHLYESDSELSELSEPPEELEPIISLPMVGVDMQKKSSLAVPQFKKAEKVTEQGTNGPVDVAQPQDELPKIAGKKQTWLGTNENGGNTKLQVKCIEVASWKKGGVVGNDKTFLGRAQILQESQVPKETRNGITTTIMGGAEDRKQEKPPRMSKGLIDSGVDIPTSLEKPNASTKTQLKRTAKPTPQPAKKTTAGTVRKPPNFTKQVKDPVKDRESLDIYELPSDDENDVPPVKEKCKMVKQNLVPVKGKGKTMVKKPTPKPVAKSALGAEKCDTRKLDIQHRNKAGALTFKVLEVQEVVRAVPTAMKPTAKVSEISKELKNSHGKKPHDVSVEVMKSDIDEERQVKPLVHKTQGYRAHETTVQRSKETAVSKPSIQETGKTLQDVRALNRAASRIPAKHGSSKMETDRQSKVEVPAFGVQILNTPGVMAHEARDAKLAEASKGSRVSKGELISVLSDNIPKHTEAEINGVEVEGNILLLKASAIDGHGLKLTPVGKKKLTTSGIMHPPNRAQTTLKRKAKVSEVGHSCKRLKELPLVGAEPVQPPGRTRRAAANIALAKLKLHDTSSSQDQDEEESNGAVKSSEERCRSVELTFEENRLPHSQERLFGMEELNSDRFPDFDNRPHVFESIAERQHSQKWATDIPNAPCIAKPEIPATPTDHERLEPVAMVVEMEVEAEGDGSRALLSGPKEVEVSGVKGGPGNNFQQNFHVAYKSTLSGARVHSIPVRFEGDAPGDGTIQAALDKPINETGIGKRKRIVRPQPAPSIATVGHSRKQPMRQSEESVQGNKTSQNELQAALDPKTRDVSRDNQLNRKPQIISWGKQGPLTQDRLVNTCRVRGHSILNPALDNTEVARRNEEHSPSQRVRTKMQKIATTIKSETRPGNTEYRTPVVDSRELLKQEAKMLGVDSEVNSCFPTCWL